MEPCRVCGEANAETARFCSSCGTALTIVASAAAEERKVVSILFVDLVGFTARSETADPEDVRATLRPYHERVRQEIERFGGTVEKFVGDAVMAVFGAPTTHEDDAERAVRAGLRVLEATHELGLEVRSAINSGEAVVSLSARPEQGEGIVAGDVVNTAARLQGAAPVGALVVGEGTYRATKGKFEYEELEPVAVKGKADPVPLWRAVEPRSRFGVDVDAPAVTPFLGRDDDLALLERTYARMLREQAAQLVTIVGEPGVGKTRLVAEFSRYVDEQPELVFWRQGRCLPYGEGITFWALGEMVKGHAGILESDGPEVASAKLRDAVATAGLSDADRDWVASRLGPLVGIGDGAESVDRAEAFAAWRAFFEQLAAERPLVLVFEDLHWADESLLEFVEHLADWVSDLPLLVVCTARPELYAYAEGWGGGKRNSTTISLSPLAPEDTARLVAALLARTVLPDETQAALLDRAGGNPLYAEEFARMLADRGLGTDADVAVPENVQALIAARLDTLAPELKSLLQDAAVLGKVFWAGAVAAMGDREDAGVRDGLHELARKEFVRRARVSSMADDLEYAFWHVLVRDVAYGQIPRPARARKHVAAAEWLAGIAGERATDHAELLAHHYATALDLAGAAGETDYAAELEEPTVLFLIMAGDRATSLEPATAEHYYLRALELLRPDDPRRARLLVEAADNAELSGRMAFAEVRPMFEEAIASSRAAGDNVAAADALRRYEWWQWIQGEPVDRRQQLLEEARRLIEQEPPGPMLALVYGAITHAHAMADRPPETLEWANRAIPLLEQFELHDVLLRARTHRGIARIELGEIEQGLAELRTALADALASGRTYAVTAIGAAHNNLGMWEALVGDGPRRALELFEAVQEIMRRRGATRPRMWQLANMAGLQFELGQWDEALASCFSVLEWDRAHGGSSVGRMAADPIVRIRALRGDVDGAAALIDEALPPVREAGDSDLLFELLESAALVEDAAGRTGRAVGLLEELEQLTRAAPNTAGLLPAPTAARIGARAADLRVAEQLVGRPVKGMRFEHAEVAARAVIAEAKGETAAAAELYADAAARWRDYGFVLEEGYALLGLGRCRLALGQADAETALDEARAIFTRLGATPLVGEVEALLVEPTASATSS